MKLLFLFFLTITFFTLLLAFKKSRNSVKTDKIFKLNKKNFYDWMNFSKKERYLLAKKDSNNYINKRKILLDQIRNEYKNISGSEK